VDFGLSVTDKFSLLVFQLTAEGDEVGTSSGGDLVEELDDYLRVNAVDGEHELGVLLVSGVVNLVTVGVSSDLGVFFEGTVIEVIEIVQGVAEELFVRAKVVSSNGISHGVVVDGNQRRCLVVVVMALLGRGGLFEVLLPLGLEELVKAYLYLSERSLRNFIGSSHTLSKIRAVIHACHADFGFSLRINHLQVNFQILN
jgi:hypothetical protein